LALRGWCLSRSIATCSISLLITLLIKILPYLGTSSPEHGSPQFILTHTLSLSPLLYISIQPACIEFRPYRHASSPHQSTNSKRYHLVCSFLFSTLKIMFDIHSRPIASHHSPKNKEICKLTTNASMLTWQPPRFVDQVQR